MCLVLIEFSFSMEMIRTVLTFPQEPPGTLQLLADAGCVERRAQMRNVHVHICTPRDQSLHTAVMTWKPRSMKTATSKRRVEMPRGYLFLKLLQRTQIQVERCEKQQLVELGLCIGIMLITDI